LFNPSMSRLAFFIWFTYFMCIVGIISMIGSLIYFLRKKKTEREAGVFPTATAVAPSAI
jgi:hypothetical protein